MTDPGTPTGPVDPPPDPAALLKQRMRTIADQAHRSNVARAEQLGAAVERLASGDLDPEARAEAAQVAHKLAGSSGTFGYHRVSEFARRMEQSLSRETPDPAELAPLLGDLAQALAGPPDEPVE